jgi:lipopolysaccharide biosynthesis glycosyltransferase
MHKYLIYGAGHYGVLTAFDLEKHGFKAKAFIDKNANQIKTRLGLPVLELEEVLSNNGKKFKIIIAIQDENAINEITEMFKLAGLRKNDDFMLSPLIPIPIGYFESIKDLKNAIKERYDIYLHDEETARHLANSWNGIMNKPQNLQFIENAIPVVLCANEDFAPYMAVMLQSLLDYSNPKKKYHFIIFERNFTAKTKDCLIEQVLKFPHCVIDFVSMQSAFDDIPFVSLIGLSIDAFSRLFIPYWLDKYPKVIYLDSDMIARADISKLYDLDIKGYSMGAVLDGYISKHLRRKDYSVLNMSVLIFLENPSHYFNSGVLVFDTQKFREKISYQELFRFAIYFTNRYKIRCNDQDVLNIIAEDDYFILPSKWNYTWSPLDENKIFKPTRLGAKIIHFIGTRGLKPWKNEPIIANNPDALAYRDYAKNVSLFRDSLNKH